MSLGGLGDMLYDSLDGAGVQARQCRAVERLSENENLTDDLAFIQGGKIIAFDAHRRREFINRQSRHAADPAQKIARLRELYR